ncbi:helix-turn-helix domain-containing protein [Sphingobium lactosutens]|uniref:XRE family transcriptional regulator n=1 Tax=Sphingobium lactosutens DS20 TaxID=1331060 RepID=T0J0U0_9SPHN|nr:helix-turn-helix domain-containing protein [Sphingobium lactosutens]EQB15574.1 XRE family transcriptional regulator [Sphingobium lactosutens DS20]
MIEPTRLSHLLADRELSQSELARRVGVSQATIYRLVSGLGYGSKHIHKIARELQTTPAYLSGETDDPQGDAPALPMLDADERDLIDSFKNLTSADRRALLQIARTMAGGPVPSQTVHAPARGYRGEKTK